MNYLSTASTPFLTSFHRYYYFENKTQIRKMQFPVIHRLHHYLQKQHSYFLSQLQPSSLAFTLFLTILATVLIIRFRQNAPSIPLLISDHDYSDDDDDDEISSSSSEFEDEEEEEETEEEEEDGRGEYFRVRGSSIRRRSIGDFLSLSEIANSKSVVKLWDAIGFGLGFDSDHSDGSVVSIYDKPPAPAVSSASPVVLVSTGENASGNLALRVWDTRLRRRIPAVMAEWGPSLGKTVGVEKVYVRDDGRYGLTVGDMRNVKSPLDNVTESQLDLWWPNSFIFKI